MFDFITDMWQMLQAFFLGVPEAVTGWAMDNPFMLAVTLMYVVGLVIAAVVFAPKSNA